jgi:cytochrome c oxidase subunit I+III
VVLIDFVRHLRSKRADYNPWDALSLEWMSGQSLHGFRSIMPIASLYPLWEQKGLKDEELSGRGYLPDAPTRERESLVTAPITSEPDQILRMPGPGWTAFVAALATAIAFAGMTLKSAIVGCVGAAVAVAAYLYWPWSMDAARPRALADAGRDIALPLYSNGSKSVGWWGTVVLLISDAAVVASFIFAYLFLWTARPALWPPTGLNYQASSSASASSSSSSGRESSSAQPITSISASADLLRSSACFNGPVGRRRGCFELQMAQRPRD